MCYYARDFEDKSSRAAQAEQDKFVSLSSEAKAIMEKLLSPIGRKARTTAVRAVEECQAEPASSVRKEEPAAV